MKYIKIAIYLLTLIAIGIYIYSNREQLDQLSTIEPWRLGVLLSISLVPVLINALIFRNNLRFFNLVLPMKEWFGLNVSATMYNFILPARGGLALRGVYLKKKYNFSYTHYIAFLSGIMLIRFMLNSCFAITLYCINIRAYPEEHAAFMAVPALVLILSIVLIVAIFGSSNIDLPSSRLTMKLQLVRKEMHRFHNHPKRILMFLILQLAFLAATSYRLHLSYKCVGIDAPLLKLLQIQSLIDFTILISITPGNIGLQEGLIGLSASFLGISTQQAITGAVFDRIVSIIPPIVLGLIFSRVLLNSISENTDTLKHKKVKAVTPE